MELPIKIDLPDGYLDEETRCGYTINSKMKAVWAVELDLLKQIDNICTKYGIQYFACAGTMLGTVRHKGIIPWDDDIDVMMLRCDYEKLCTYANEFDEPYFFQTEFTDPGAMRGHAQLRNSKTTAILDYDRFFKFNQGIFIDIFPLDRIPDDKAEREAFFQRLTKLRRRMRKIRDIPAYKKISSSKLKYCFKSVFTPILSLADHVFSISQNMYKKYEDMMKSYNDKVTKEVGILSLVELGDRFSWDLSDLEGDIQISQFEFLHIPLPAGYRNMLTKSYGDWNMPVQASTSHGNVLFDPYKSYKEYIINNR